MQGRKLVLGVLFCLWWSSAPSARAEWLDAFDPVATVAETQGPAAALEMSREALERQPQSLALLLQYSELLVETGGVHHARDTLELWRTSIPAPNFELALALCDRSTGRTRVARRRVDEVFTPTPEWTSWLDRWAADFERLFVGAPPESLGVLRARVETLGQRASGILPALTRSRLAALRARDQQDPDELSKEASPRLRWSRARNLLLSARLRVLIGDAEGAERDFRDCASLSDSLQARRTGALARSYFGLLLDDQDRYREATEVRSRAVAMFESLDDSVALAHALMGLGWDLDHTASTRESVVASERSLDLWTAMQNRWGQTQTLNNLGVAQFNAGQLEAASQCLGRGLELADSTGNAAQRLMIRNNLALVESRRGRPDRAVDIYREILALHRESGDVAGQRSVLNNLGLACLSLGESEQAREYFIAVRELGAEGGRVAVAATINLAMILADEARLDEATGLLSEVGAEARSRGDLGSWADILAWSGRIAERRGDPREAWTYFARADSLRALRGDVGDRVPTLIRQAMAEVRLGRLAAARRSAQTATELAARADAPAFLIAANCVRADVELAAGNIVEAQRYARTCLQLSHEQQWGGGSVMDPSAFQGSSVEALRILARSLAGTVPAQRNELRAEILKMSMEIRTRQNLAMLTPESPAGLDSLRHAERALREEIQNLRERGESGRGSEGRLRLTEAETEWHALRRDLSRRKQPPSAGSSQPMPSEDELRGALGSGTVLLGFVVSPGLPQSEATQLLRLWMAPGQDLHIDLVAGEETLRQRIKMWNSLAQHPAGSEVERRAERKLATELSRLLLPSGVVALLRDREDPELVISGDGVLSGFAFAALVLEAEPAAGRLVEFAAIERASSWASWYATRSSTERAGDGASERAHVERADPKALAAAARGEASWPPARVLHIESHGYFDDLRPWLSGLYFDDPADTGRVAEPFLQQADLSSLRLGNDLITLAACETARREDSPLHSSAESFAGTLEMAGARAVLASHWKVERQVSEWTTRQVYRRLAGGLRLSRALQQTQLELLADPRTADPCYWAGWSVMGDGAQRIPLEMHRAPLKAWAWWGLSTLLAALAIMLWRRSTSTG